MPVEIKDREVGNVLKKYFPPLFAEWNPCFLNYFIIYWSLCYPFTIFCSNNNNNPKISELFLKEVFEFLYKNLVSWWTFYHSIFLFNHSIYSLCFKVGMRVDTLLTYSICSFFCSHKDICEPLIIRQIYSPSFNNFVLLDLWHRWPRYWTSKPRQPNSEIMKWNEKLNWQFYKEDLSFNEGIEAQNFTVSP